MHNISRKKLFQPQSLAKLTFQPALHRAIYIQKHMTLAFGMMHQLKTETEQLKQELSTIKEQCALLRKDQAKMNSDIKDNAVQNKMECKALEQSLSEKLESLTMEQNALSSNQTSVQVKVEKLLSNKDSQGVMIKDLKKKIEKLHLDTYADLTSTSSVSTQGNHLPPVSSVTSHQNEPTVLKFDKENLPTPTSTPTSDSNVSSPSISN